MTKELVFVEFTGASNPIREGIIRRYYFAGDSYETIMEKTHGGVKFGNAKFVRGCVDSPRRIPDIEIEAISQKFNRPDALQKAYDLILGENLPFCYLGFIEESSTELVAG